MSLITKEGVLLIDLLCLFLFVCFRGQKMRPRELPPLPPRGQKSLPTMLSQGAAGVSQSDDAAAKHRKKVRRDDSEDQDTEMGRLSSRTESHTSDKFTRDSSTEAPLEKRRKKKKKTATIDLDNDQADLVSEDAANRAADGEGVLKKSRKKKRSKVMESQLPDELDIEDDDVITDTPPPMPQHLALGPNQGQSQPSARFFVEKNKRFQPSDWRKTSVQMDNMADLQHVPPPAWTTRDVSVRVHEGFRVMGLYCHGFLAGFAMWNVVVVYMLSGQHLTTLTNLLQQYHSLAYPAQCLLYLLLAVSTVAAFDRVNLGNASLALRELITLDAVALAAFLYFSALILSLSQQMTSDRINLYATSNATLWPPGSEHQVLNPWVTINLVVALLVGVAWIFIGFRPEKDFTEGYLMTMEIDPPKPEDKSEMNA
uniref:Transmembrane protein 237b n=1 Tax=Takifugu rubripes TaxID=31033 RepID=A0A674PMH7_TAKRU